jgi:hypothetical protein
MSQEKVDPRERVAECDRVLALATDPLERSALVLLRELWLALISQLPAFSEERAAEEIAAIEKIHNITLGLRTARH